MAGPLWPIEPGLLLPFARPRGRRLQVTQFEDGPPEVTLRNRAASAMMSGTLKLTGTQREVFEAWGEDLLAGWSLPFRWEDPLDGRLREMQFAAEPEPTGNAAAGAGFEPDRSVWTYRVSLYVIT